MRHDKHNRYDGQDRRDSVSRVRYEKAVTVGELCQAIEQRRIPSSRQGDEYIVRVADVRGLHGQRVRLLDDGLGIAPGHETSSLEVGRPA